MGGILFRKFGHHSDAATTAACMRVSTIRLEVEYLVLRIVVFALRIELFAHLIFDLT